MYVHIFYNMYIYSILENKYRDRKNDNNIKYLFILSFNLEKLGIVK